VKIISNKGKDDGESQRMKALAALTGRQAKILTRHRCSGRVRWTNGQANVYRIAAENGSVDLIAIETAVGGYYYLDHLPSVIGNNNK
jgi:hypothetical protein